MLRISTLALLVYGIWLCPTAADQVVLKNACSLQQMICVTNNFPKPLPADTIKYDVGVVQTDSKTKTSELSDMHTVSASLSVKYGFSKLTSVTAKLSYQWQHKETTTTSQMTTTQVSKELSLSVPELDPNQTWCAYRLQSEAFQSGENNELNLMFKDIFITDHRINDTSGAELVIDGEKENWDEPKGYLFSTKKWGNDDNGWFLYMQDDMWGDGNVRAWQGDPGDQGHLVFSKREGNFSLLSTKKWADWYVYMQDQGDGNVRGWSGDPGDQGHWQLEPHPYKPCFLISTKKWPGWYMYMQDVGDGNVRGWEGHPGDQGCWVITHAYTLANSTATSLVV